VAGDRRNSPSFLSTSLVAKIFGVKQDELRAMIDRGTLPEPNWMQVGSRVERIYSLEWLALASESVNLRRLPGFDDNFIVPPDGVQVSIRFDRTSWDAAEIVRILSGLDALWVACIRAWEPDIHPEAVPSLVIRRMSAGSPFDVLAWAKDLGPVVLGVGGAASLLRYVMKHPESIADALPRVLAAWHAGWGRVDEAKMSRIQSRANLERFVAEVEAATRDIGQLPADLNVSGPGMANLESIAPASEVGASGTPDELAPGRSDPPANHDGRTPEDPTSDRS
jgi:hypothetical protein